MAEGGSRAWLGLGGYWFAADLGAGFEDFAG